MEDQVDISTESEEEEEDDQELLLSSSQIPSLSLEPDTFSYIWQAVRRKGKAKEALDSKAGIFCDLKDISFSNTQLNVEWISYRTLVEWAAELVSEQCIAQRQFEAIKLTAVVSYHGCRAMDEVPITLKSEKTFKQMITVLKTMKKNKRRIITVRFEQELKEQEAQHQPSLATLAIQQRPLASVSQSRGSATEQQPATLEQQLAEETGGDFIRRIRELWRCEARRCRNFERTCWIDLNKSIAGREDPEAHYPVDGNYIYRWSEEIRAGKSTSEQPSPDLRLRLRDRKQHRAEKNKRVKEAYNQQVWSSSCSQSEKMMATVMSMATAIMAPLVSQPAISMRSNQIPTALPLASGYAFSSLVQTTRDRRWTSTNDPRIDPRDILHDFFDYWVEREAPIERRIQLVEEVRRIIIKDEWKLDNLKEPRRGGRLTEEMWEKYGLQAGLYGDMQAMIIDYKALFNSSGDSRSSSDSS